MNELFTYKKFQPGTLMGTVPMVLDDAFRDLWNKIYPWDAVKTDLWPMAVSTVILMKAWRTIVDPRPPGNVHAGQKVKFLAAPRVGENVDTQVKCIDKEERKGRNFVTLQTVSRGSGDRELFIGDTILIWAA